MVYKLYYIIHFFFLLNIELCNFFIILSCIVHKNVLNTWKYKVMDNHFYYTVIFWHSFIFFIFLHKMSQLLARLNIMDNKSFLFNVVFILVVFNFFGQFCFVVWGFVVCAQILFYFSAHKMSLLERFNIMHNNKFCLKYYHFCLHFFFLSCIEKWHYLKDYLSVCLSANESFWAFRFADIDLDGRVLREHVCS